MAMAMAVLVVAFDVAFDGEWREEDMSRVAGQNPPPIFSLRLHRSLFATWKTLGQHRKARNHSRNPDIFIWNLEFGIRNFKTFQNQGG
jgi:hypothetical protein